MIIKNVSTAASASVVERGEEGGKGEHLFHFLFPLIVYRLQFLLYSIVF